MPKEELKFVDGLIVKARNPRAPSYIKGNLSLNVKQLAAFLATQTGEWVNVDIRESKGGKLYAAVNNWKSKVEPENAVPEPKRGKFDDDIPFS